MTARQLTGRCADGAERDHGSLFHYLEPGQWKALCGAKPGRRSAGWGSEVREFATCPRCIAKHDRVLAQQYGAAMTDPRRV